jgi:hypothetical protein
MGVGDDDTVCETTTPILPPQNYFLNDVTSHDTEVPLPNVWSMIQYTVKKRSV